MTSTPQEPIFRFLPDSYRRAGRETPAALLTKSMSYAIGEIERLTRRVLASRFLEHLEDLSDAERLAALYDLAPWPGESLEAFRVRLRTLIPIYLKGSATNGDLLTLVGLSAQADQVGPLHLPTSTDRYRTWADFQVRHEPEQRFSVALIDAPPVWNKPCLVTAEKGFLWMVESLRMKEPSMLLPDGTATRETYPNPIVEITAGEAPVIAPVIAQRSLHRYVLINRTIPPGATISVDLDRHEVTNLAGPASLEGPILFGQGRTPDLLYGVGGMVGDAWTNPALRTITWFPSPPSGPDPNFTWPDLIPPGTTWWQLLLTVDGAGRIPALNQQVDLDQAQTIAATTEQGPRSLLFRWKGRLFGTFALLFRNGADEPWSPEGPALQMEWLMAQFERLKVAGTVYLEPKATALVVVAQSQQSRPAQLSLWDEVALGAQPAFALQPVYSSTGVVSLLGLGDSVTLTVTKSGTTPPIRPPETEPTTTLAPTPQPESTPTPSPVPKPRPIPKPIPGTELPSDPPPDDFPGPGRLPEEPM